MVHYRLCIYIEREILFYSILSYLHVNLSLYMVSVYTRTHIDYLSLLNHLTLYHPLLYESFIYLHIRPHPYLITPRVHTLVSPPSSLSLYIPFLYLHIIHILCTYTHLYTSIALWSQDIYSSWSLASITSGMYYHSSSTLYFLLPLSLFLLSLSVPS